MAPPLSLEGALSALEGTLGIVCKLQQVFWCPLKEFTDQMDPLNSYGGSLSV